MIRVPDRRRLALVLAWLVVLPAGAASAQGSSCVPRSAPAQAGLTLVGSEAVDERTTLYTFRSAAVGPDATPEGLVRARVILPAGYAADRDARFPLWLNLHGTGGNATGHTPARWQEVLGDAPVIFVEPDGGEKGFYSDWWGAAGSAQPPGWETFHLRELLPWLEARLRTNGRRAVSGGSMGGFGAMSYAARNPGLFAAAGSSSGVLDTELLSPVGPMAIQAIYDPCIWGDPSAQRDVWEAHNPAKLAAKLRGVSLFVAVGNGLPGRHDTQLPDPQAPVLEIVTNLMTRNFVTALETAGVPVTTWFYGNGTHPWSGYDSINYDYDNLRRFLPQALEALRVDEPGCAAVAGRVTGRRVHRVALGRTVAVVRRAYPSVRRVGRYDAFCLHDGGRVRVAYGTAAVLRGTSVTVRRRLARRAVLALSSSPAHAVRGLRPGDRATRVGRVARRVLRRGTSTWHVGRAGDAALVVRVSGGLVREVGLADARLTRTRRQAVRLLAPSAWRRT